MTTIPNKAGLALLAIFWSAMAGLAGLTGYALRANGTRIDTTIDQRSGGCSPPLSNPGVSREPEGFEGDVRSSLQTLFQAKKRAKAWKAAR